MASKIVAIGGSFLFFWAAPGTVAGVVPFLLSRWEMQPPLLGLGAGRLVGAGLVALGCAGLVECFLRFALEGRGTPAPVVPTEELVVSGLYGYLRNPMYVAVVFLISGQALLLGSGVVLFYAGAAWLLFYAFVALYEEPMLQRRFGTVYQDYRVHVHRWRPRLTPWRGPGGE